MNSLIIEAILNRSQNNQLIVVYFHSFCSTLLNLQDLVEAGIGKYPT